MYIILWIFDENSTKSMVCQCAVSRSQQIVTCLHMQGRPTSIVRCTLIRINHICIEIFCTWLLTTKHLHTTTSINFYQLNMKDTLDKMLYAPPWWTYFCRWQHWKVAWGQEKWDGSSCIYALHPRCIELQSGGHRSAWLLTPHSVLIVPWTVNNLMETATTYQTCFLPFLRTI